LALSDLFIPPPRNRSLAALPPEDLAPLWPRLQPVELAFRQTLHVSKEPIAAVYFPESGYVSRLASMDDGDSAEIGLMGPEGMTGLPLLLGADRDNFELMVQVPGTALRLDAAACAVRRTHRWTPLWARCAEGAGGVGRSPPYKRKTTEGRCVSRACLQKLMV
jgi:hypothetical protein